MVLLRNTLADRRVDRRTMAAGLVDRIVVKKDHVFVPHAIVSIICQI